MPLFLLCCASYSAEDPGGHRVKYHSAERPENLCLSNGTTALGLEVPFALIWHPMGALLAQNI